MSTTSLKIGLIGCGRIAQTAHLPAAEKAERVELAAVCDPSQMLAEAVGRRHGVPHFTDLSAMLQTDIDAVVIAVPDRLHVAMSVAALRAGKHVLVEKPIAVSLSEAEILRELTGRGLKLQVASMKRYDPGVQYAKAALSDGRIGKVLSATCWYRVMSALRRPIEATFFPAMIVDQAVREHENALKAANRAGHLLATHGIHTFDLMRHLLGDLRVVSAVTGSDGDDYSWHGLATLPEGGIASFEITASVHAEWTEGFEIYGSRGHVSVQIPFPFSRQASIVKVFVEGDAAYSVPVFGDTDPYKRQLEAFATAVLDRGSVAPDTEDGIAALAIVEAVRNAASVGAVAR